MQETSILDVKTALGKNIADIRKRQSPPMSQEGLALAIGKSVQAVNKIENGKSWPDYNTIQLIAKALKVEETELFNDPGLVAAYNYEKKNK